MKSYQFKERLISLILSLRVPLLPVSLSTKREFLFLLSRVILLTSSHPFPYFSMFVPICSPILEPFLMCLMSPPIHPLNMEFVTFVPLIFDPYNTMG